MSPIFIKPWILAAAVAVASAVAFGCGWLVADWRKGAELESLSGENRLLESVRSKCESDIKNVRAAMQAIETEAAKRVRQAEEAMKQIEPVVKERTVTITKIKTLPPVPLNLQCEAIKEEQLEYVQMRREG